MHEGSEGGLKVQMHIDGAVEGPRPAGTHPILLDCAPADVLRRPAADWQLAANRRPQTACDSTRFQTAACHLTMRESRHYYCANVVAL